MPIQIARAAILVLAAALRLWRLDQNGYDNEYYAAAVRSMSASWHAVLSILTPERLAQLVAANQVRFAMQGDLSLIDRRMGAVGVGKAIAGWIREHGTRVDPALWRAGVSSDDESGGSSSRREARIAGGLELYDLRRGADLVPARMDR
jgi:hypothetical protein